MTLARLLSNAGGGNNVAHWLEKTKNGVIHSTIRVFYIEGSAGKFVETNAGIFTLSCDISNGLYKAISGEVVPAVADLISVDILVQRWVGCAEMYGWCSECTHEEMLRSKESWFNAASGKNLEKAVKGEAKLKGGKSPKGKSLCVVITRSWLLGKLSPWSLIDITKSSNSKKGTITITFRLFGHLRLWRFRGLT